MIDRRLVVHLTAPAGERDALAAARVHLVVEDVSLLDEFATRVAEATAEAPGPDPTLVVRAVLDPRRRHAVRVHVDRDGTGVVVPGDLIGSAPVPEGEPAAVELDVRLGRVPAPED